MSQNVMDRVRATPRCDWPVADKEQSGIGNFIGLYGGEHIAATEFVIGATLVQYGCTASDILIGLFVGNFLAVLCFTFFCAKIATQTRLTLYSYLGRIFGNRLQKVYNIVLGLGLSALAAAGISISATAIRRIFNVPIQLNWYPTSAKFVLIVLVLGAVITFIVAKGFEGVSKFATTCVPWMIALFFVGMLVTLPQLLDATGYESIRSPSDFLNLLNTHVWNGSSETGQHLGVLHVIGFAWTCNLAWHIGLNDMPMLRYAKDYKYGYASAVGMYIGHFFAWVVAGVFGATAAIILNTPLTQLDPGAVTFTLLGYTGLLAVIIAGWTTANPTIYRIVLSFNVVFSKVSQKRMTYIMGTIITVAACFPCVQKADAILVYLGMAVEGAGVICICEHFLFPHIGFTRYWNEYRHQDFNTPAAIAWGVSIIFSFGLVFTGIIHRNLILVPTFVLTAVLYTVLAGLAGARQKYPAEEADACAYRTALQDYANKMHQDDIPFTVTGVARGLRVIAFGVLSGFVVSGILCAQGVLTLAVFKSLSIVLSLVYFVCNGAALIISLRKTTSEESRIPQKIQTGKEATP